MNPTFSSLGIRDSLCGVLQRAGLTEPTPVQERTIPFALAGRDVIVQAQTGTGKTMAFLLPLMEKSAPRNEFIRALILTPTRELAIQITSEARKLADAAGATVMAVYGGQDVIAQAHRLGGSPDIVIATPGRLLDHIRRGTIDLSRLSALVLDEADQMLHMGFLPEVEEIIRQTPDDRQTMLFSATFPESVRVLSERYMNRPEDIRVQGKRITLDEIRQYVVETTDRQKKDTLLKLLHENPPFLAVIFCRTKIRAKKLTESLAVEGLNVDELHGDLTQAKREAVMKRFREARVQLLVATDVAARGLDVDGVTHVYNYDIPQDPESYIHRIGRTGRAGQQGVAVTLAAPKDAGELKEIERAIGSVLERKQVQGSRTSDEERSVVTRTPPSKAGTSKERTGKRWQGRSASDRASISGMTSKGGARRRETGNPGHLNADAERANTRTGSSRTSTSSKERRQPDGSPNVREQSKPAGRFGKQSESTPSAGRGSRKGKAELDENRSNRRDAVKPARSAGAVKSDEWFSSKPGKRADTAKTGKFNKAAKPGGNRSNPGRSDASPGPRNNRSGRRK